MSLFKPKFVLLAALCVLLPLALTSACSGGAFTAAGGAGGSSSPVGGTSSSGNANPGGADSGTGDACDGPEDCDDKDLCTVDMCNGDGSCGTSALCSGTLKCCEGDCANCCDDQDCDDGVSCTENKCFAGRCMYVPDHTECEPSQRCSVKDGCRAKQVCGIVAGEVEATTCDDGSACTADTCVGNFCENEYCATAQGVLCCEGVGCAQCCDGSDCDTDKDPCTVGSCEGGKCSQAPLCGREQQCCPSADGTSATCGSCCSAAECNDNIVCTEDKCTAGSCSSNPDSERCDLGFVCNPDKGCEKAVECTKDEQCVGTACQTGTCVGGSCAFVGCGNSKCCANGCAACCDANDCSDNIACTKDLCDPSGCTHSPDNGACAKFQFCDATLGCIECKGNADCDNGSNCDVDTCDQQTKKCVHVSACLKGEVCNAGRCTQCLTASDCGGVVIPPLAPIPIGFCNYTECVDGTCQQQSVDCGDLQQCCSYGCSIHGCLETQ